MYTLVEPRHTRGCPIFFDALAVHARRRPVYPLFGTLCGCISRGHTGRLSHKGASFAFLFSSVLPFLLRAVLALSIYGDEGSTDTFLPSLVANEIELPVMLCVPCLSCCWCGCAVVRVGFRRQDCFQVSGYVCTRT